MSWDDTSGKKLFRSPHIDIFGSNKMPDLFQKVKSSGDDRSRSILVNLILEYLTDILLSHLIKNYERFVKDNKNLSFYLKLSLLNSFDLLPDQVFTSINCLREIRNKFAHRLDIVSLSDLDKKTLIKIDQAVRSASFKKEALPKKLSEKISKIEFHAIVGLYAYEPNLKLLRDHINSPDFQGQLDKEYKTKLRSQFKLMDDYLKGSRSDENT
jgi:hypothetical protein